MKHSCDTNKWQMQFQIKVLPSHFEGGNDKLRLVRRFDAGACFSKFKNTGRVLENKLDVLSGWHSPGREGLLFLLHDPVSLCLLNKKLGKLQEKKSWFKTSRHTCFVLTSPCHGRTNCFNQFQSALEPKGKKKEAFKQKCQERREGVKMRRLGRKELTTSLPHAESRSTMTQEEKARKNEERVRQALKRVCIWRLAINDTKSLGCKAATRSTQVQWGSLECFPSGCLLQAHPSLPLGKNPVPSAVQ